jgi:hypothetical protein
MKKKKKEKIKNYQIRSLIINSKLIKKEKSLHYILKIFI